MEEKIIMEAKPSFIVIVPHVIAMSFMIGIFTIWKPLIAVLTTKLKLTDKRIEGKKRFFKNGENGQ